MQKILEISDNEYYYKISGPYGYGYQIVHRLGEQRVRIYHTYNKLNIDKAIILLKKGIVDPTKFPSTENETPTIKRILFIKEKHFNSFYKVDTLEEFQIKVKDHLKEFVRRIKDYEPNNPFEYNEFLNEDISLEDINELPEKFSKIKKILKDNLDEIKNNESKYKIKIYEYENLKNVIKNGKGNYFDALHLVYPDYQWELIDLQ